ncbi:hypothetical protein GW17_00061977 [Ensete ventricosum]|nr:hypothetical protein GW17_00061977 [Ensete ventricosum]
MRLNRVELFYALVAAIGSESRCCLRGRGGHMHVVCMQRWLATARPSVGAVDHAWLLARGDWLRPPEGQPPADQPARKALPPAASPTASRGGGSGRRGGYPLARRLPGRKGQSPPA